MKQSFEERLRITLRQDAYAQGYEDLSAAQILERIAATRRSRLTGWLAGAAAIAAGIIVAGVVIGNRPPLGAPGGSALATDTPSPIAIPTQEPPTAGTPGPCPAALTEGRLVADSVQGIALIEGDDTRRPVIWPYGYFARATSRGLEVVDSEGVVVAREGDRVEIGGGETGPNGDTRPWLVCGEVVVLP